MSLITSLFTVGASTTAGRSWCRPTHRAANCAYASGGNSCCVCIPATATCYVIEMWGQGGGGAGSCCCMGSCFGGQAGSYGWITCSTSNQAHTMCMCVCQCNCRTCGAGAHTGSPGQLSVVCDCSLAINWTTSGGCGGSTCCFGIQHMNSGCAACGGDFNRNSAHSNMSINCCCFGMWIAQIGNGYSCASFWTQITCDARDMFQLGANMPFLQRQGTNAYGCSCNCCTGFKFYAQGGCGWSAPDQWTWYANDGACGTYYSYQKPLATYCGCGMGHSGGSAYAGGAGQCCNCDMSSSYFGGVDGNFPGGGGSSASMYYSPGSCCNGSCGGQGLVLISWS